MENVGVNIKAVEHMENEELVARIKAGIDVAENMLKLWYQTKKFIHGIAKHYQSKADIEDLEQEGYLALYDAVDGYIPEKGIKFLTYAEYWIKQRMIRYIQSNTTVRLPVHEWEKVREYRKMVNTFQIYLGRKPTRLEIAHNMGISIEQVEQIEKSARMGQLASIEAPLSDEADGTIGDMVASDIDVEGDVLDNIEVKRLCSELWEAVEELPAEQSGIIGMRYKEGKSVREIVEATGMADGKVRRLEVKAIRGLRYSERLYSFSDSLPDEIGSKAYYGGVGLFNRTWTSATERVAMHL